MHRMTMHRALHHGGRKAASCAAAPSPAVSVSIPAAAAAECRRVALTPHPWLVADMDSTLIRKARGEWPELADSPVQVGHALAVLLHPPLSL